MTRLAASLIALVVAGCASGPQRPEVPSVGDGFRISEFRQGLVNIASKPEPTLETIGNDFPYRVNGECRANGKTLPCMWHGFEFTFESPTEDTVLTCRTRYDKPHGEFNPTTYFGVLSVFDWHLVLKGRSGHFTNPQYSFQTPASEHETNHYETTCFYRDTEVLRFTFTIHGVAQQLVPGDAPASRALP